MALAPWTFHASCLRDGTVEAPAGLHEVLLIMRDAFDLLGPEAGQAVRLLPGTVLQAEIDPAARDRLALHLGGTRASSGFRYGLGLMLGLDGGSAQGEALINDWIDDHVAVVLLPVMRVVGEQMPRRRYDGLLNSFAANMGA